LGKQWNEYRRYLEKDIRNYLPLDWSKAEVIVRGGLMKALNTKIKTKVIDN